MRIIATMLVGVTALAMGTGTAAAQAPYGYQQGYGQNNNVVGQVIGQILGGGRYGAYGQGGDRMGVDQCARAAEAQVSRDYRPGRNGYQQGYGQQGYGHAQGYMARAGQVVAITDVQRRNNGLRVSGLIDSGRHFNRGGYGYEGSGYQQSYANAYGNPAYAARSADLRFSCRVDYRGQVRDVDINRNTAAYRPR